MYKLLKVKKILSIHGVIYRVDHEIFGQFEKVDEEIIKWLADNNYGEDTYLICEYNSKGKYVGTDYVVFFYPDPIMENRVLLESAIDGAENDFRVMGDVANRPVADKYLFAAIRKGIKEFNLEYEVAGLIENKFYEKYL